MSAHAREVRAAVLIRRCLHCFLEHAQSGLVQPATRRRSTLRRTGSFRFDFGHGGSLSGLPNGLLTRDLGCLRRFCCAAEHIDIYELVAGRYERSERLTFTESVNDYALFA